VKGVNRNTISSIIPGTWRCHLVKHYFGLTCHHHPWRSPLPCLCTVLSAPAIFKCILKVVFWECVQHHLLFWLDHFSCVKKRYLQLKKQRSHRGPSQANRVDEGDSHAFCYKKFHGEKGSVRWCVVMMQQPVPLLPKFCVKSSHISTQSP
jgi:hypothetical protein